MNVAPSRSPIRGALLDLGSNSFKLLLAEQTGSRLVIHHETAFPTRLGEQLVHTGQLSPAALRRALAVLRECRTQANQFGASRLAAIGTSAIRSARNARDFLDPAARILGTPVRVVSGTLEGRLVFEGILSEPRWARHEILDFDLGGGSLEVIHGRHGRFLSCRSLPLGCVRIRDRFFVPSDPGAALHAQESLHRTLRPVLARFHHFPGRVLASGGTVSTFALLLKAAGLRRLPPLLTRARLARSIQHWSTLSPAALRRIPGMPPDRAEVILPGAVTLLACLDLLDAPGFHWTFRGLRYGAWVRWISGTPFGRVHHLPGSRS